MFDVRILRLPRSWSVSLQTVPGASRSLIVFLLIFLTPFNLPALVDSNHNDLNDLWEELYHNGQLLPPGITTTSDADGDGRTNLDESIAGTNPLSGTSVFQLQVTHIPATYLTPEEEGADPQINTPEAFQIQWPGVVGKQYTLQCSPSLTSGSWYDIGEPIAGDGSDIIIGISPGSPLPDKLFWRASVTDIPSATHEGFTAYEQHLLETTTNPWWNADSDHDGLTNAEELAYGFDPNLADSNQDGTDDLRQYSIDHPASTRDTDGDGASDAVEFAGKSNPLDVLYTPPAEPYLAYEGRLIRAKQPRVTPIPGSGYGSYYQYRQFPFNSDSYDHFPEAIDPSATHADLLQNGTCREFSKDCGRDGPLAGGPSPDENGTLVYGPNIRCFAISHDIANEGGGDYPIRVITNLGEKIRLENKWSVPEDVSYSYVQAHLKVPMLAGPIPQGSTSDNYYWKIPASSYSVVTEDTDAVSLIIPKGSKFSNEHELKPPIAEAGMCHLVTLFPIEIVNHAKLPASELKVAKMIEFGVLNTNRTIIPNNDQDCFYIRVRGGAALGNISVKVSTADNPDAEYNDDPTEINLHADGDDAISDSQILVSDDEDDDHPIDGIADDSPNDRSHKIQLGGNLVINAVKIAGGAWSPISQKTPVRKIKTVQVNVVILREKPLAVGGTPLVDYVTVDKYLKIVKERYAQVGVKIEFPNIEFRDPPQGVDLSDGLKVQEAATDNTLSSEVKRLIEGAGTVGADDIHIFFVNKIVYGAGSGPGGQALGNFALAASENDYTYNAFIGITTIGTSIPMGGIITSHELGHLLRNAGHANFDGPVPRAQLMIDGGVDIDGILSSKRLSNSDEIKIQGDPHAQ